MTVIAVELFSKKIEVRPGRNLFYTNTVVPFSSNIKDQSFHLLFIHGSCGASSQFHPLIHALQRILSATTSDTQQLTGQLFFHLFDAWGCGQSACERNTPDYYKSFSDEQLLLDLEAIIQYIQQQMEPRSSLFIAAHSYGVSQIFRLLLKKITENSKQIVEWPFSSIQGIVAISAALRDVSDPLTRDGGHFIFRYLPVFLLKQLQNALTHTFVQQAIHPENSLALRDDAIRLSNSNDMAMCKAFYSQQRYISAEEVTQIVRYYHSTAESAPTRYLLIHGNDDLIFVPNKAQQFYLAIQRGLEQRPTVFHTSDNDVVLIGVDHTRHQVFQEKPDIVAKMIWDFIKACPLR